jgi:hypothetical protein
MPSDSTDFLRAALSEAAARAVLGLFGMDA